MPPKKKAALELSRCDTLVEGASDDELKGSLLRGESFSDAYCASRDLGMMRRLPTMRRNESTLIPENTEEDNGKYLLVFDIDETIVYARDGPLVMRPHAEELLKTVGENCEVALWTAGVRDYAKAVLAEVEKKVWGKSPAGIIKHCISRSDEWFGEDYTKDLSLLGRKMDKVLIIENTPECVRLNPKNGIIVEDFEGERDESYVLRCLTEVVMDLVKSGMPVQKFIPKCKQLERQRIKGQGDVFYLTAGKKGAQKVVKENRDKLKRKREASSEHETQTEGETEGETEEESEMAPPPKKVAKKAGKKPAAKKAAPKKSK